MRKTDRHDEFRAAVADVQPLAGVRRADLRPAPPAPLPVQTRRDESAALAESLEGPLTIDHALESGEELAFLREGLARDVLRRLRRGHWSVEASLDLHGMNRVTAAQSLAGFVKAGAAKGLRCVCIVHGKGLGSLNREPILKHVVRRLLPRFDEVLACCQAPSGHGGGGAALVLLKGRGRSAGR